MVEKLEKSILAEAVNLLKAQKKDNNDNNFGVSFLDLFKTKNEEGMTEAEKVAGRSNNNDLKNNKENEINAQKIDSNSQDHIDVLNKNNRGEVKALETNLFKENNTKLTKNTKDKESDSSKISLDNKDDNKKNILKKDMQGVSYEMVQQALQRIQLQNLNYKDLDIATREKIKEIIRDLKMGKISEEMANAGIMQIVNSSDRNKIALAQKGGNTNIKNDLNKKESIVNSENNNNKHENIKVKVEHENAINDKSKTENSVAEKKGFQEKIKKIIEDNKELKNNDQGIKKEASFEINLNSNDGKVVINDFIKNKNVEPQKLLEQNKESVFNQIAKNTKIVLSEGQTRFSTMIRPEELGRIDLKFQMKDGKVNGRMILQSQETADFFKSNVEELKAVFQKANVELENIDIILAGNNFNNTNDFSSNDSNNSKDFSMNNLHSTNNKNYFEENSLALQINYSQSEKSKINIIA